EGEVPQHQLRDLKTKKPGAPGRFPRGLPKECREKSPQAPGYHPQGFDLRGFDWRGTHPRVQMNSARSLSSAALGLAPLICLTTSPFWNTFSVGIARIWYRCAMAGFSSTFSLTTSILSACSLAISSRTGAIIRHGPHHSAQWS